MADARKLGTLCDTRSFSVAVRQPLGYLRIEPSSGKSLDEELHAALTALKVERDEVLTITVARPVR